MAIFPETARAWAERQGPSEKLQAAVKERLLADDPLCIGHGRMDEFPEDVVISLLQDKQIPDEQRKAVARGWRDARREVEAVLEDPDLAPNREVLNTLTKPFTRVFRVAELTRHPLLRDGVRTALPLVAGARTHATPRQVQQVVAAAMAYPDVVDRVTWQQILDTKEEVAAYAFRMLLDLDRDSPARIAGYFKTLLEKQFGEARWDIDVWFLAEYARTAGLTDAVKQGIEQFLEEHPDKLDEVTKNPQDNPCWPKDIIAQVKRERERELDGNAQPVRSIKGSFYREASEEQLHSKPEESFNPRWLTSNWIGNTSITHSGPGVQASQIEIDEEDGTSCMGLILFFDPKTTGFKQILRNHHSNILLDLEKAAEVRSIKPFVRKDDECLIKNE